MEVKMKIAALTVLVLMLCGAVESTPNTNINEWRCNANSYSQSDAYAGNVEYVLADLLANTPNTGYDFFYDRSPSDADICYGYANCGTIQDPLAPPDCADCLSAARDAVIDICPDKIGAMVSMVDCTIRYENYHF